MPGTVLGDGDVVMKKRHVGETNKNRKNYNYKL